MFTSLSTVRRLVFLNLFDLSFDSLTPETLLNCHLKIQILFAASVWGCVSIGVATVVITTALHNILPGFLYSLPQIQPGLRNSCSKIQNNANLLAMYLRTICMAFKLA